MLLQTAYSALDASVTKHRTARTALLADTNGG